MRTAPIAHSTRPMDLGPLFAHHCHHRPSIVTAARPVPEVDRTVVEPTVEPLFYGVLRDLGATWMGVPSTGRDVVEGRVLDDTEPASAAPPAACSEPTEAAS